MRELATKDDLEIYIAIQRSKLTIRMTAMCLAALAGGALLLGTL
jgi:hypothetical protein